MLSNLIRSLQMTSAFYESETWTELNLKKMDCLRSTAGQFVLFCYNSYKYIIKYYSTKLNVSFGLSCLGLALIFDCFSSILYNFWYFRWKFPIITFYSDHAFLICNALWLQVKKVWHNCIQPIQRLSMMTRLVVWCLMAKLPSYVIVINN